MTDNAENESRLLRSQLKAVHPIIDCPSGSATHERDRPVLETTTTACKISQQTEILHFSDFVGYTFN
jgi:hypothetical protein